MPRKTTILVAVLVLGLALDQGSKILVQQLLPLGSQVPVVKGFFNLVHIHNRGAAFGLLGQLPVGFTRIFFITVGSLLAAAVSYLWWRLPRDCWRTAAGYSLILAGALGNLLDRLRLGEVVDFLDFYWGRYHWPAFNVADSLVCLGAAWLVWVTLTEECPDHASDPV
jgi:signal peptidase II